MKYVSNIIKMIKESDKRNKESNVSICWAVVCYATSAACGGAAYSFAARGMAEWAAVNIALSIFHFGMGIYETIHEDK
jgi:hypothetical protein